MRVSRSSNAGIAAQQRRRARPTAPTGWSSSKGEPAAQDLRKSIASVQPAADNLNAMITDARPGVQNFSKSTLPEANRLVRDLRELSQSLQGGVRTSQTAGDRRHARARQAARLQAEETVMKLHVAVAAPLALASRLAAARSAAC